MPHGPAHNKGVDTPGLNSIISIVVSVFVSLYLFLISQYPRERLFLVQISLFIVTFLSLVSQVFAISVNHQRSQPTPLHCTTCQYVECLLVILVIYLLIMPFVGLLVHGFDILVREGQLGG